MTSTGLAQLHLDCCAGFCWSPEGHHEPKGNRSRVMLAAATAHLWLVVSNSDVGSCNIQFSLGGIDLAVTCNLLPLETTNQPCEQFPASDLGSRMKCAPNRHPSVTGMAREEKFVRDFFLSGQTTLAPPFIFMPRPSRHFCQRPIKRRAFDHWQTVELASES